MYEVMNATPKETFLIYIVFIGSLIILAPVASVMLTAFIERSVKK